MPTNTELFRALAETKSEEERRALRNRIVVKNVGIAYWFAKRHCTGVPKDRHEDVQQECLTGLIEAAERFDLKHGASFSTYAAWWMRHQLQFVIGPESFGGVTVPRYIRDIVIKTSKEGGYLDHVKRGKHPDFIKGLDIAVQVHQAQRVNLDGMTRDGNVHEMLSGHVMDPETHAMASEALNEAEKRLVEIETTLRLMKVNRKEILARRYGFLGHQPADQAEVARQLNCSRQNVQQVERKALEELVERTGFSEQDIVHIHEHRHHLAELVN
ncbi:sigma-70 family RNA polymerase sigma factor [Patescibacteria group bacterium]|nr:sigma-70 family RNA polymerase sigma factor [Patescibacteria group bacterium]